MIYCVEDDDAIRALMIYTLAASGFKAVGFPDGESFFAQLKKSKPQLVVLDIMLPGEDGLQILKRLKGDAATSSLPVIMATAKGTEYDRVIGLDSGADDYLSKPFGMMEMVSRVRAVLRRTETDLGDKILRIGEVELKTSEHTVTLSGKPIKLTVKEFELLRLFMENPGRLFTREQLLLNVWESDYAGETRTVDVHIGTLRAKLSDQCSFIETVRGVGYRCAVKE